MGFAVEMYFDEGADARIRRVWTAVAAAGVSSLLLDIAARPHVSLSLFETVDARKLKAIVAELVKSMDGLSFNLESIGVLVQPGVVYLAPTVTPRLLQLHQRFHETLRLTGMKPDEHYLPERWIPHCTVAMELAKSEVPKVVDVCAGEAAFGPAEVREIGLVEYRPVRELFVFSTLTKAV